MSSYPTLPVEAARRAFDAHLAEQAVEPIVQEATVQVDGAEFDEARSIELSNVLWELAHSFGKPGYLFERQAVSQVHQRLGLDSIVAGDAGFWRWLTFSVDGQLAQLVDWRYPSKGSGHAREQYFGFGPMKAGMYAYLWLCARAVFDPTSKDPYELSRRGDVDIWQSHIVRIDFGSVPQMARAFIRFILPKEGEQFLYREQYRQLAREMTRRNASMAFELLDDSESLELIGEIWEQRGIWGRAE